MTIENNVNENVETVEHNEVATQNTNNAVDIASKGVKEGFVIQKDVDGKFKRKAVYNFFSSITPETREEKIKFLQLIDSDEIARPMGDYVNQEIIISDVIFNPYDKVNEDTGEIEYGILSYIIDPEGNAFVTSSKSVYHTLKKMFVVFGEPHYNEEEQVKVQIVKKKGQQFQYTDIKIIG